MSRRMLLRGSLLTQVVLLLCALHRPALADGALNFDGGKVISLLIVCAVILVAAIFVLVWLGKWLARLIDGHEQRRARKEESSTLPVARTMKDSDKHS